MTAQDALDTFVRHLRSAVGPDLPVDPEQTMAACGIGSLESTEALTQTMRELRLRLPLSAFHTAMTLREVAETLSRASRPSSAADALQQRLARRLQAQGGRAPYTTHSYASFLGQQGRDLDEIQRFSEWIAEIKAHQHYTFEAPHLGAQRPEVPIRCADGREAQVLSLSSYNYLGYAHHPEVIQAARAALERYGLGATSSPVISGTFAVHRELEEELVDFFGVPGAGVSLFSSGYGANVGTISAFLGPGSTIVCDRSVHMSILAGAQPSRAPLLYFDHDDMTSLAEVLASLDDEPGRVLVCVEGVYSADGDTGMLAETVRLARAHRAFVLVDEAHSMLVAGPTGRGACEAAGVLDQVDLLILTFSKSFGGVGGALVARAEIVQYINWYARCRMFSCALDPAVTGGILAALRLARGPDGAARRARLHANADLMRSLLAPHVRIGPSESWIVPVIYGREELTAELSAYLQGRGLEIGVLTFPAVPRNEARIRLFITSEHTPAQLQRAAGLLIEAAEHFGFRRPNPQEPS